MDLVTLLETHADEILAHATDAMGRLPLTRYERADSHEKREWLRTLHALVLEAIKTRDLSNLIAHEQRVARDRHAGGYNLIEVQMVCNVLEDAMWGVVAKNSSAQQLAESLGLVHTALRAAKDALSFTYAALATKTHVMITVAMRDLFKGTQGF